MENQFGSSQSRLVLFRRLCCTTSNVKRLKTRPQAHNIWSSRGWGIDATTWYLGTFRVVVFRWGEKRKRRSSTFVSFPHAALMTTRPLSSCVLEREREIKRGFHHHDNVNTISSRRVYVQLHYAHAGCITREKRGRVISFFGRENDFNKSKKEKEKVSTQMNIIARVRREEKKPCQSDMRK